MSIIRLDDELADAREAAVVESMRPDLVQRIQGANGHPCPLQAERREIIVLAPEAAYYAQGDGHRTYTDGCCVLQDKPSGTQQCYIARGHTTEKEACPVYLRVLEQLGL